MSKFYTDILDKDRLEVWKKLVDCANIGSLAGGTALALILGHRKSFDFDIFSDKIINKGLLLKIRKIFGNNNLEIVVDSGDELTIFYKRGIKISFIYFPFKPLHKKLSTQSLSIFDLRDLLSNKAYVVGRRGAWRDYVDIYWSLSHGLTNLTKIITEAKKRFTGAFSEKLFLEQLVYFDDINDFAIEWVGEKIETEQIKQFLTQAVSEYLVT